MMYACFTLAKLEKSDSEPGDSRQQRMPLNKCGKQLVLRSNFTSVTVWRETVLKSTMFTASQGYEFADSRAKQTVLLGRGALRRQDTKQTVF